MGPLYFSRRRQIAGLAVALAIAVPVSAKETKPAAVAPARSASTTSAGSTSTTTGAPNRPDGISPDLAKLGVKATIDLTNGDDENEREQRLAESAGMKFFKIAMNTRVVPTAEQIATFLSIVNDPANQPVYVHCVGGRHRTGVMTAIYRMIEDKWTPDRAFQEMKSYKYGADFLHPEFKKFVLAFKPALPGIPISPASPEDK